MYRGHVDISHLNNWHLELIYQAHYDPQYGFGLVHDSDQNIYDPKNVTVHVARDIGNEASTFFHDRFGFLKNAMICVQKMLPGMILPTHTDKFSYYTKMHAVDNKDQIMRIIVFLEPWQPGHVSEVDGQPNTLWKAGDWISWFGQTPHMAANIGQTDRYTLQITGMVNKPLTIS